MHFRKYDPLICFALGQAGEVIRAIVSGLHKKKFHYLVRVYLV